MKSAIYSVPLLLNL